MSATRVGTEQAVHCGQESSHPARRGLPFDHHHTSTVPMSTANAQAAAAAEQQRKLDEYIDKYVCYPLCFFA